jgi:hypothetical protein
MQSSVGAERASVSVMPASGGWDVGVRLPYHAVVRQRKPRRNEDLVTGGQVKRPDWLVGHDRQPVHPCGSLVHLGRRPVHSDELPVIPDGSVVIPLGVLVISGRWPVTRDGRRVICDGALVIADGRLRIASGPRVIPIDPEVRAAGSLVIGEKAPVISGRRRVIAERPRIKSGRALSNHGGPPGNTDRAASKLLGGRE